MMPSSLRLLFAGTPEFAASALAALLEAHYSVVAVYTQPDRPKGRGLEVSESAVKGLAKAHNLPICQPLNFKDPQEQEKMQAFKADLMIVAAYGLLLPPAILAIPRLGCLNIHASLLPRWRGASPIQHALLSGDKKTGISLMQMTAGLDEGPVLMQTECPIEAGDTSQALHDRLAILGGETLLQALPLLIAGKLNAEAQEASKVTYAPKISKKLGKIDWHSPIEEIDRQIRAFYPWPIAFALYQGEPLRIFSAEPLGEQSAALPGTIVAVSRQGLDVAARDGVLRLREVQLPGSRILPIADFLNSRQDNFKPGMKFD